MVNNFPNFARSIATAKPEQLFDLDMDPGETQNLVRDSKAKGILAEHRGLLAGWIAETQDDFRPSSAL